MQEQLKKLIKDSIKAYGDNWRTMSEPEKDKFDLETSENEWIAEELINQGISSIVGCRVDQSMLVSLLEKSEDIFKVYPDDTYENIAASTIRIHYA